MPPYFANLLVVKFRQNSLTVWLRRSFTYLAFSIVKINVRYQNPPLLFF